MLEKLARLLVSYPIGVKKGDKISIKEVEELILKFGNERQYGEIFTSPEENNINGIISFSYPAIYSGRMVEGVKLEVKDGKIINARADKGEDFLLACINTDDSSKYFGEVAIGTNYNIKQFTRNILFDEKIGGTIHMAIGCSMPDAGGKNISAIHWDMICNMVDSGKIFADNELFYENGKFLDSVLKK